jgi:hypothetical protein
MNCKCAHFWGAISLLSLCLTVQGFGAPDVTNGRFELYDYNQILDINTPTDWQCENYTAVVGYFVPQPGRGATTNWRINLQTGLLPFEGEHFLVLSTGNVSQPVQYAKVWQSITVQAGEKLTGVYFFGTCDYIQSYPSFNDWGEITLVHETDPNQDVNLVHVAVEDVGSFGIGDNGSMSGWKRFEYVFDANHTGTYNLIILVSDYGDLDYESYLAVDGLVLCHNPPVTGDLNCDCTVDFQDFALLAADWLCDCNDPNVHNDPQSKPDLYNDPNFNCLLGTDLTGDGPVDTNDLQVMSEHWLEGTKE